MSKEKQIYEMANDLAAHCPDLVENGCGASSCVACLTMFLHNAGYRKQGEGEWRPVSDPPKKNGRYWVYGVVGGQPLVCVLYFTVRDGFGDDDITHWMPLPEPPQTEGGAE